MRRQWLLEHLGELQNQIEGFKNNNREMDGDIRVMSSETLRLLILPTTRLGLQLYRDVRRFIKIIQVLSGHRFR